MTRRPPIILGIVLVLMWLLLNGTVAPGQIILGIGLTIFLLLAITRLRPLRPRMRRFDLLVRLFFVVLFDIVRSNIGVGRIVLGLVQDRKVRSGFIDVPLDLRDPHGLAVLAMIVTSTPGTVWVELRSGGSRLTLHVLDLKDEAAWVSLIKNRYEQPLMRIFE